MAQILVIEDDAIIQQALRGVLEHLGHEIVVAGNGKEGVAAYQRQAFDLVLTDCVMPEMEGIETLQALKKLNPAVKVIAMSGGGKGDAAGYLRMAQHLGAKRILEKPFSTQELMSAIAEVLALPKP